MVIYNKYMTLQEKLKIIQKTSGLSQTEIANKIGVSFEKIHPFSDGNGRIGRLIIIAMLLRENIAPAIIKRDKKSQYYNYLNKAQAKKEFSQLENFICDAIFDGFEIVKI